MSGGMDGRAEGEARIYQASGDQHIAEHHHHAAPGSDDWHGPDSVRRASAGRMPVALRDRAEIMALLRTAISAQEGNRVYVLHGLGGCGKTAVALAAFQLAVAEAGRVGLWVNAADRTGLRGGMLAVAADRGALDGELSAARSGLRPAADLVWDYLDRSEEPWLLVLDNADEPIILREGGWLRTSRRGVVLVTTRQAASHWWPGAELHHIGVLPREDAAQVLYDLAPNSGSLEEAADIADRLGHLPLALTLAGGFLSRQVIDPWTMATYSHQLEDGRRVALIDRGADALAGDGPRNLVGRTWQLTLDSLRARGVSEAAELLGLLARWSADPLPLRVLNSPQIGRVLPQGRIEIALRALIEYSLVELVDAGVRCVLLHSVLQDSVAAAVVPDRAAILDGTALSLLDALIPAVPEPGPNEPLWALLVPHASALSRHIAEPTAASAALALSTRLSIALHRSADYLSALELLRAAASAAEPILGAGHRLVLVANSRAARALFRLGRYPESEALHRHVLAAQEQTFGSEDEDTLASCHALQLVLFNVGQAEEGGTLLRRAVVGRQRVLGPAHALTLRSRSSLLAVLSGTELAAEIDSQPMSLPEECTLHLGADHAVTLGARLNHARALREIGRFDAADEEARLVAQEYRNRYGPDYPITLAAEHLSASAQASLGRLDSAVDLMVSVTAARARVLGADHPFTAVSSNFLTELRTRAQGG
jgi:tetratricopeptide (TPR) repeat protein